MGYVIGIVIVLLLLPLLIAVLSRRTTGIGGVNSRDRGVTPSQPSSDQPTPGGAGNVNQPAPGAEDRMPPTPPG